MNTNGGPDPETLRHLHGMLPSLIKGHKERRLAGKGNKVAVTHARQVCKVCLRGFDLVTDSSVEDPKPGVCPECQKNLDEGLIAFVSADRYAFAKSSEKLKDMAGQIVQISPHVMDTLVKCFELEDHETEGPQSNDT